MVERIEYLQNIIDEEANASEFYFNYPPKPDDKLDKDVKLLRDQNSKDTVKSDKKQDY